MVKRPRIAAVVTEFRRYSHAQHILDRYLYGYSWNGRHHVPDIDLVAVYTDQQPDGELSRERAKDFPRMKLYPTIAEALCRGGRRLDVDGVLLIGEHGNYPTNKKGQRLYPRYEFFQQIVNVFRESNRSVPVFNDKHLSWNWDWALEMVETARELDFPLLAGSSLPVTRRIPQVDMPLGARVEEALCVAIGGVDGYDIHALEAMQSMVERRDGGETGVEWIEAATGVDAIVKALAAGSFDQGGWDPTLFRACLCRSHQLVPTRQGFNHTLPTNRQIETLMRDPQNRNTPVLYRYQHRDGLRMNMLLIEGVVNDFTFAARLTGHSKPLSVQMFLSPREVCNFFNPLTHATETLFQTGQAPYPIERTLLTTGLTAAGIESLYRKGQRLKTPHLDVSYHPPQQSTYWSN
ncbi:MAG TPA: hypothetical protein DCE43_09795 [Planctomycetaceae bacterium]|nr:hypothetical protein [Planctomycetaceae bacterium]